MKKLLLAILILIFQIGISNAERIPIDYQKWQDGEQKICRIGNPFQNYQAPDSSWGKIFNNWTADGDTAYDNLTDVITTKVLKNGKSIITLNYKGVEYQITQKLKQFVWINTDNWNIHEILEGVTFGTPTVNGNVISWPNVIPKVDYEVEKNNCSVAHRVIFKKQFLDSIVILYNARPDSMNISLGNVMVYTVSDSIDHPDSLFRAIKKRKLKQFAKFAFELSEQQLHFPGSDTLPPVYIYQEWRVINQKYVCIEYVKMGAIKKIHEAYPDSVIWHNDVTVISGAANTDDATIKSTVPDNNFGGSDYLTAYHVAMKTLVRVKNVDTELGVGATNITAVCSLYCGTNDTDGDIMAYSVWKPWVEGDEDGVDDDDGDVTWNDWASDASEWTTAGCESADDGGSDNSGDGVGADRKATAEDTETVTTVNTWYGWNIPTGLATSWYNGTKNEEGVILITEGDPVYNKFRSNEWWDAPKRPFWTFTYTVGAAPTGQVIIVR